MKLTVGLALAVSIAIAIYSQHSERSKEQQKQDCGAAMRAVSTMYPDTAYAQLPLNAQHQLESWCGIPIH